MTKPQANRKIKKDTARQLALDIICAVLDGGAYANIALNKALRAKKVDELTTGTAGSLRSWSMVP